MTTLVLDASAAVAVLTDSGRSGTAVAGVLRGAVLVAPDHFPFEVANVLRRLELAGGIGSDTAALAHADLLDLPLQLWPYSTVAEAAWRLRGSLSVYDGAYVALAARLDAPLVTLDQRLARAAGSTCRVVVPGDG